MKNPFKKEIVNYKDGEPLTPYQRAQQEWDLRIGTSRVQAKNWRILAVLSSSLTILLAMIVLIMFVSRKDHIYVAEVTKEGKIVNVAPLQIRYQPTEAEKEYFITHFIDLVRSIPLDPVLAKKNWLTAYGFLDNRGAERLNHYIKESNPIALLGKKTVTIQIVDVNPISRDTSNVNWVETTINANGQEESKKNYSGIFTLMIKQPTKTEEILRNPLGIRIVDFSIKLKEGKNQ